MSLFEDGHYQWRETYFVLFGKGDRPAAEAVVKSLEQLGPRYELKSVSADEQGKLESLTLLSHGDFAAMDVTYLSGDEVVEQVRELADEMRGTGLNAEENQRLEKLPHCDARFDVYHFEEMTFEPDEDDEMLDPGALLIVLERLARICNGVGVDPQSGTLV
ncbi:MAG: hypothetical protein RIC55_24240 [Pirellulaceae bacterium]